jgi:putative methylase
LEQISTSAEIASRMIFSAAGNGDISNCSVGDFGCGPGMLSIASSLMKCDSVVGIELDTEALDSCWVNLKKMEIDNIELINADVRHVNFAYGMTRFLSITISLLAICMI